MSSSSSWTLPMDPSPDLQLALAYNTALESWNEEMLMATFDDTLDHRILPKSLRRPLLTKRLYQSYFQGLAAMFKPRRTKVDVILRPKCSSLRTLSSAYNSWSDRGRGHRYSTRELLILSVLQAPLAYSFSRSQRKANLSPAIRMKMNS